jgi:kynurenine formamidase
MEFWSEMGNSMKSLGALLTLLLAFATVGAAQAPPSRTLETAVIIDLTHPFDEHTIYWPTAKPFTWEKESWGKDARGYWYAAARFAASEHGGTHLDSPIHFAEKGDTADRIGLERLIGPAAVIDISEKCSRDPDYRLSAQDITQWEAKHAKIQPHAILLVRTGWSRFWPDRKRYLGTDAPGDTKNLRFPGLSREAAELLAERGVDGVGIDTASLDYGQTKDFIAHRILSERNIYGLENLAHLDRLPASGATLIALPMKIKGGTGGPVRVIAILP